MKFYSQFSPSERDSDAFSHMNFKTLNGYEILSRREDSCIKRELNQYQRIECNPSKCLSPRHEHRSCSGSVAPDLDSFIHNLAVAFRSLNSKGLLSQV